MARFPQELVDLIAAYLHLFQAVFISDYAGKCIATQIGYTKTGRNFIFKGPKYVVYNAVVERDMKTLDWLYRDGVLPLSGMESCFAAIHGHLDVFSWLDNHLKKDIDPWDILIATSRGNIKILQYAYSCGGINGHESVFLVAAGNGHLHIVEWLYNLVSKDFIAIAMAEAAANDKFEVFDWLSSKLCPTRAATVRAITSPLCLLPLKCKYMTLIHLLIFYPIFNV